MGEPARKIREDIEPEIRPNLYGIDGGGQSTPDRANLKALESNPEKLDDKSSIKDSEETGSNVIQGPWSNKVTSKPSGPTKGRLNLSGLKKNGPLATIIITLVGGGLGIGGLLSPSLLIVNLKEVMTDKFNLQLASMDTRTNKILRAKVDGTTRGLCTSVMSVACKYSTMSKTQLSKFEKAGIHVVPDTDSPGLLGRTRPASFDFDGKTIDATEFNKMLKTDPKFRTAVKKAYSPKFAGFTDEIWQKVASKLKISKSSVDIDGDTDEERLKKIQDNTKEGVDIDPDADVDLDENKVDPDNPPDGVDADDLNTAVDAGEEAAEQLADNVDEIATSGIKSAPGTISATDLAAASTSNLLKITGVLDNACLAYNTVRSVGFAAKTVRVLQLARFAMIFLNEADQIKAGDANPDDVSYLGKILTTEFINKDPNTGETTKKSATDSFGYKYAAYGDTGTMPDTAAMFLAGGGLTGTLIGVTSKINDVLGGNAEKTCGVLNNPFVGAGSLVVGIGTMLIPGANTVRFSSLAKDALMSAGIGIALAVLPALLQDIIAGVLVDKTTVGEAAGDAITSGASGMMGNLAKSGGNAPLTPEQAVAYSNLNKSIVAEYAEEDRLAYSPFDISNNNTFMGSFVRKLTPHLINMSSISSSISSIFSMVMGSFSLLQPSVTKATTADDYKLCTDIDYRKLNVATDPYCNVIYGIPPEALEADPIEVATRLIDAEQIDEEGEIIGSEYKDFIEECIDRENPLGYTSDDNQVKNGKNCFFSDDNKDFYIYYIDKRIQDGMDAEETVSSSTPGGSTDPGDASQPDNTVMSNKGWTFKTDTDYSGVACADGTTEVGVFTTGKHNIKIRVCQMPDGLTKVSSLISKRTLNMINAAKEAGIKLKAKGIRSSFRTIDDQMYFREQNCPDPLNSSSSACTPDTALPGSSMHERGLAIDFENSSKGGAVWNWLDENGASYGYFNYPPENWHWSMNGS